MQKSMPDVSHSIKIFSDCYYGWFNKGDAALVTAHLKELSTNMENVEHILSSDTPDDDRGKFDAKVVAPFYQPWEGVSFRKLRKKLDAHVLWRLPAAIRPSLGKGHRSILSEQIVTLVNTIALPLSLLMCLLGARTGISRIACPFSVAARESFEEFRDAQAILLVPGGYLMAFSASNTRWYKRVFPIFLAKLLKKPVVLAPCSIGPFVGWRNRLIARFALILPDHIYVRERFSLETLTALGISAQKITVTTDAALLLSKEFGDSNKLETKDVNRTESLRIACSVREHDFAGAESPHELKQKFIQEFAMLIDIAIDRLGASVIMVPQVIVGERDDDRIISAAIKRQCRNSPKVQLVTEDLTPKQLCDLYKSADVFIGVRMHANIFALCSGVPVVAIAYQSKTTGIMRDLGLEDWVIDIKDFNSDICFTKIKALLEQAECLKDSLPGRIAEARNSVEKAYVDISRFLKGT